MAWIRASCEEWITISPFVRVTVKNRNFAIETLALLDTGCETSLITQELAKELKLKGPLRQIRLSNCQIASRFSAVSFDVARVMIVPKLQLVERYVDWTKERTQLIHLADLDLGVFDSRLVGVFIGANVVGALRQLDIREPKERGPYGVLTPFGWTILGEIPARSSEMDSPQCRQIEIDGDGGSDVIEHFWRFESFGSKLEQ